MNEALPPRLLTRERRALHRDLEQKLRYRFHNPLLLEQALAHSSFVNEQPDDAWCDNEKLEFLGDAVLELTVSMLLYRRHPTYSEGDLTKLRAAVVSTPTLADIAREMELGSFLLLGRGEDRAGGRNRASLLADATEAVLGAIYLDSRRWWSPRPRLAPVRNVVDHLFSEAMDRLDQMQHKMDYKSMLQEHTQSRFKTLPQYTVLSEEGPPHDRRYEVRISIGNREYGVGRGRSKKQAQQDAARVALEGMGALPGETF